MKKLWCIIKPFKLQDVLKAVKDAGIEDVTITEVKGYGRQKGHLELYQGSEYVISFLPKIKLELTVPDEDTETTIQTIRDAAFTGRIGDGKIFVFNAEGAGQNT
ncbi:MAG: P-II family nitrogen regulator [Candidatus Brocadiales bacterium]